jgi:hypothetical protein
MIYHRDATLIFGILITCGAAVTMALSPLAWLGYLCGVLVTLVAAAVANANFE